MVTASLVISSGVVRVLHHDVVDPTPYILNPNFSLSLPLPPSLAPPLSSEAGSYLRLIDFVHHSTLGLREIKRKEKEGVAVARQMPSCSEPDWRGSSFFFVLLSSLELSDTQVYEP